MTSSMGRSAFDFQLDGHVAGVCLGHCGETHLKACAAGGTLDFGRFVRRIRSKHDRRTRFVSARELPAGMM